MALSRQHQNEIDELLERARTSIPAGRVPARIFNDAAIYELEQERLFSRAWMFLAHESEIPSNGDYVTRYIANNSIIVARDEHGEIKANLNMCRHRGNQICKAEMGNSAHFRCSYHGWVYKNSGELIGVPYLQESYEGKLDRSAYGLIPIRIQNYGKLIFGTLDRNASSLLDFLGGFEFYLDLYLKQGLGGSEVYGPPDQWIVDTDWKIAAENFSGDGYHTPVAHQFAFHLRYFPSSGASHSQGWSVHIPGKGHSIGLGHTPGMEPFFGYPADLVQAMHAALSPSQLEIFGRTRTAVGTVFPNLSFLIQPFGRIPGEAGVRFCTMRLWHPIGPGQIRLLSWCLVPSDATDDYKQEAYRAYTLAFGQAGTFEQDDMENWSNLTRQTGCSLARTFDFPYLQGLAREPLPDWPGPGVAISPYVTENNFRNLWGTWLDYVADQE
jgi:nitrite reductase/ring-hydroxylating ferredoxin subunit